MSHVACHMSSKESLVTSTLARPQRGISFGPKPPWGVRPYGSHHARRGALLAGGGRWQVAEVSWRLRGTFRAPLRCDLHDPACLKKREEPHMKPKTKTFSRPLDGRSLVFSSLLVFVLAETGQDGALRGRVVSEAKGSSRSESGMS